MCGHCIGKCGAAGGFLVLSGNGAFTWNGQEHSFTVLLQASVNFPILSHGIIQRGLDNLQAVTWIHHISATVLIEEGKDEVASTLEALFKKKKKCSLEGGR